ncbi:MAG TPA: AAA family ATPase [Acidimicrobiales bacterium]|jgi:AAA+ superfamily predicted ATPase|nr:AAA family ATPase [Acidimicrobiales bacterium]
MKATVRPYIAQDLGRVLRLWQEPAALAAGDGLTLDQAVELLNSASAVTFVAEEAGGELVGLAMGEPTAVMGWIYKLLVCGDGATAGEIAGRLLDELEGALVDRGARRLATLVHEGDDGHRALGRRGFEPSSELVYVERELAPASPVPSAVADVGGQLVPPGLWDKVKGMDNAKQVVERRVVLPLAKPDLASRHAVEPPNAIMLFGPPGTGKTTFAKGLASLLGWAFVEIQPGDLAAEGQDRQAQRLAQTFDRVLGLASAVVFVDEVEDLASVRHTERKVGPSVTNEFLKQIPRLSGSPHHLLICATNAIGTLDPAVLRPGRFGYVLPVGPPDEDARAAIWRSYVEDITDEDVDVDALVAATDRFTPADIEFAARKAAHAAFEREHFDEAGHRATTDDFLAAIAATRPTVTEDMAAGFRADADQFTRY